MQFVETEKVRVPTFGFGTYELQGDTAREMVAKALALGYRHIDTAQMYDNEAEVGQAIAESGLPREDIWVTTKVWYDNLSPDKLIDSVKISLDKLQMDRVDLLLVHWPHPDKAVQDYMMLMQQARGANMTAHIGLSNFTPPQMKEALGIAPELVTNQVEYHAYLNQDRLLNLCRSQEMFLTAYSPIGQGKVARDKDLAAIGLNYGKTAAQVGLRWLVQQGDTVIIPRTSSPQRLLENRDVFDFSLTDEEMKQITSYSKGRYRLVNPSFAPKWE